MTLHVYHMGRLCRATTQSLQSILTQLPPFMTLHWSTETLLTGAFGRKPLINVMGAMVLKTDPKCWMHS